LAHAGIEPWTVHIEDELATNEPTILLYKGVAVRNLENMRVVKTLKISVPRAYGTKLRNTAELFYPKLPFLQVWTKSEGGRSWPPLTCQYKCAVIVIICMSVFGLVVKKGYLILLSHCLLWLTTKFWTVWSLEITSDIFRFLRKSRSISDSLEISEVWVWCWRPAFGRSDVTGLVTLGGGGGGCQMRGAGSAPK